MWLTTWIWACCVNLCINHELKVETQIECIFGCGKGCVPNIIRILPIYLAGEANQNINKTFLFNSLKYMGTIVGNINLQPLFPN